MKTTTLVRVLPLLALTASVSACDAASIGLLGSEVNRTEVRLDGPLSSLGAYRYYNGVRLLECDVRLTARATDGSSATEVRWVEATADIIDRRTGQYLGGQYLGPVQLADLWGSSVLRSGERRTSRALRYSSYAPFRVVFVFRYRVEPGRTHDTVRHAFDCR